MSEPAEPPTRWATNVWNPSPSHSGMEEFTMRSGEEACKWNLFSRAMNRISRLWKNSGDVVQMDNTTVTITQDPDAGTGPPVKSALSFYIDLMYQIGVLRWKENVSDQEWKIIRRVSFKF